MVKQGLLLLIRFYRYFISPLKGPTCRFYPTCSQYAYDALMTHGTLKGLCYALWRVLRCHPLHPGGYDPVVKSDPAARATTVSSMESR